MLRQMLKLAADAAKVELERWRNPGAEPVPAALPEPTPPEPTPEAKPATTIATDSPWRSSAYHVQVLARVECPFCNGSKDVGAYMCRACMEVRRVA